MRSLTIAILLGLAGATTGAFAQDSHLPLVEGAVWSYTGTAGQSVMRTVEGVELVGAETTSILKNIRSGSFEDEWWNFWTVTEQGEVLLHGFRNITAGLAVRYDPPIVWIDPAQTDWSTVTTTRDLDSDVVVGTTIAQMSSVADVELTVPAGTFTTLFVNVELLSVGPDKTLTSRFSVLGQRLNDGAAAKRVSSQLWYTQGVGLVRESFCCPLSTEDLSSYRVVATADVTWSAVKARFDP